MRPLRLIYYLLFFGIEAVAVLGALLGVVFLFIPFVALKALRSLRPARLVVAVGVSSPSACSAVGEVADECVCVLEPDDLGAISPWYEEFDPTGDEEVCALLAKADERPRGRPRHPHKTMERRAS